MLRMHIVLATGIYPPDIGGPATYVHALAEQWVKRGEHVTVVTYAHDASASPPDSFPVIRVARSGGPLLRWWRYARALKKHAADADIVYAFSVSCGIPLRMVSLTKPKKILRLGGDFLWERYTDRGGKLELREWYETSSSVLCVMHWVLGGLDYLVFSTAFQRDLYEEHYQDLPSHSVIENAVPAGIPVTHEKHDPLRLLFLGRLVRFKNLSELLAAVVQLPRVTLTVAGSGPMLPRLQAQVEREGTVGRVTFVGERHGIEKQKLFLDHDLLVLPSLTEISPHVALEARAVGLPVLLTQETGLSIALNRGMILRPLCTAQQIVTAIREVGRRHGEFASGSSIPASARSWHSVASEHLDLFRSL
jgi:glycosyltransferase involved in cell wall biosynthesis